MPNRVAHFEIHCDNLERGTAFYRDVFGWDIQGWPMPDGSTYWMAMTAPKGSTEVGISGGFVKRPCPAPAEKQGLNAFCCTIVVDDFDAAMAKALEHGAIVAMPKFALTGMAWQGYFIDTEGNTVGLHQADANAK